MFALFALCISEVGKRKGNDIFGPSGLNEDRVMNGLRLQKMSDLKLHLVNGTLTVIYREKKTRR